MQSLKKIKTPVLDLSVRDDLPGVLETNTLKAETAKAAGNAGYRQVQIQGANLFLAGKEDELVETVAGWIEPFGT